MFAFDFVLGKPKILILKFDFFVQQGHSIWDFFSDFKVFCAEGHKVCVSKVKILIEI